jgi:hypothetical protein
LVERILQRPGKKIVAWMEGAADSDPLILEFKRNQASLTN